MSVKIQLRRDTAANWASVNPVLSSGEIGVDTTSGKFKIGDNATTWNSLAYSHILPSELNSASADLYNAINSASTVVNSNAISYANSASANVNTLAQNYANTAQSNAETSAQSYANTAQSNAETSALGYANAASAHVNGLAQSYANTAQSNAETSALGYANAASAHVNGLAQSYANTAQFNAETSALGYANAASAHAFSIANSNALNYANSASAHALSMANAFTNSASNLIYSTIVNSAPEVLDTLNEISTALNNDASFATTITNSLATKLDIVTASSTYATQTELVSACANAIHYSVATAMMGAMGAANAASAHAFFTASALVSSLTTKDIEEDTNLYFTSDRAIGATAPLINSASSQTYYDAISYANSASANAVVHSAWTISNLNTSNIEESVNLYFTGERVENIANPTISTASNALISYVNSASVNSYAYTDQKGIDKNTYVPTFNEGFSLNAGTYSAKHFKTGDFNVVNVTLNFDSDSVIGNRLSFTTPNVPTNNTVFVNGQYKSGNFTKKIVQSGVSGSTVFLGYEQVVSTLALLNLTLSSGNYSQIVQTYPTYTDFVEDTIQIFPITTNKPRPIESGNKIEVFATYES